MHKPMKAVTMQASISKTPFTKLNYRTLILNKFLLMSLMVSISGCAQLKTPAAPIPENFALENKFQKHMQTSQHWKVVADDLADQMKQVMQQKKLTSKPVYLNLQTSVTPFTRAFNDFLITRLVQKGVAVSQVKTGSRIYNYKIQLLKYESQRGTLVSDKVKWTTLAAGLVVVRNIADALNVDGAVLGAGAALDAANLNFAPNLEVIITSSLLDGSVFIARSSDIYYANEADIHFYQNSLSKQRTGVFDDPFYDLK